MVPKYQPRYLEVRLGSLELIFGHHQVETTFVVPRVKKQHLTFLAIFDILDFQKLCNNNF